MVNPKRKIIIPSESESEGSTESDSGNEKSEKIHRKSKSAKKSKKLTKNAEIKDKGKAKKTYLCKVCGIEMRHSHQLVSHMWEHSVLQFEYTCEEPCCKSKIKYVSKATLAKHKMTQHEMSEDKAKSGRINYIYKPKDSKKEYLCGYFDYVHGKFRYREEKFARQRAREFMLKNFPRAENEQLTHDEMNRTANNAIEENAPTFSN